MVAALPDPRWYRHRGGADEAWSLRKFGCRLRVEHVLTWWWTVGRYRRIEGTVVCQVIAGGSSGSWLGATTTAERAAHDAAFGRRPDSQSATNLQRALYRSPVVDVERAAP